MINAVSAWTGLNTQAIIHDLEAEMSTITETAIQTFNSVSEDGQSSLVSIQNATIVTVAVLTGALLWRSLRRVTTTTVTPAVENNEPAELSADLKIQIEHLKLKLRHKGYNCSSPFLIEAIFLLAMDLTDILAKGNLIKDPVMFVSPLNITVNHVLVYKKTNDKKIFEHGVDEKGIYYRLQALETIGNLNRGKFSKAAITLNRLFILVYELQKTEEGLKALAERCSDSMGNKGDFEAKLHANIRKRTQLLLRLLDPDRLLNIPVAPSHRKMVSQLINQLTTTHIHLKKHFSMVNKALSKSNATDLFNASTLITKEIDSLIKQPEEFKNTVLSLADCSFHQQLRESIFLANITVSLKNNRELFFNQLLNWFEVSEKICDFYSVLKWSEIGLKDSKWKKIESSLIDFLRKYKNKNNYDMENTINDFREQDIVDPNEIYNIVRKLIKQGDVLSTISANINDYLSEKSYVCIDTFNFLKILLSIQKKTVKQLSRSFNDIMTIASPKKACTSSEVAPSDLNAQDQFIFNSQAEFNSIVEKFIDIPLENIKRRLSIEENNAKVRKPSLVNTSSKKQKNKQPQVQLLPAAPMVAAVEQPLVEIEITGRARKRRNVLNLLKDSGYSLIRSTGGHDQFRNPNTGDVFTLPQKKTLSKRAMHDVQNRVS